MMVSFMRNTFQNRRQRRPSAYLLILLTASVAFVQAADFSQDSEDEPEPPQAVVPLLNHPRTRCGEFSCGITLDAESSSEISSSEEKKEETTSTHAVSRGFDRFLTIGGKDTGFRDLVPDLKQWCKQESPEADTVGRPCRSKHISLKESDNLIPKVYEVINKMKPLLLNAYKKKCYENPEWFNNQIKDALPRYLGLKEDKNARYTLDNLDIVFPQIGYRVTVEDHITYGSRPYTPGKSSPLKWGEISQKGREYPNVILKHYSNEGGHYNRGCETHQDTIVQRTNLETIPFPLSIVIEPGKSALASSANLYGRDRQLTVPEVGAVTFITPGVFHDVESLEEDDERIVLIVIGELTFEKRAPSYKPLPTVYSVAQETNSRESLDQLLRDIYNDSSIGLPMDIRERIYRALVPDHPQLDGDAQLRMDEAEESTEPFVLEMSMNEDEVSRKEQEELLRRKVAPAGMVPEATHETARPIILCEGDHALNSN